MAGASVGAWALTRPDSATPSYRVVTVARITLSQSLSSTGTIEPTATSTLSFAAPGQVTAVDATVGEHVAQGQTLAAMDSATLQAQVAQAQASLAQDQSRLSQDESGSASSAQLAADQASVNADQAQVDSANEALGGATLTSPIDGIVVAVGITVGQQAGSGGGGGGGGGGGTDSGSAGGGADTGASTGGDGGTSSGSSSSAITVISASDVVNANVDASVVGHIKAGDQVVITTEGAHGLVRGTVGSIGLVASTSSGVATFPVVIDVTGTPAGLYEGASATVSIIYHQLTDVLAVPAPAVRFSGGRSVVDTIVNGRRVPRTVSTGLTTGGLTQIISGLTPGEQVAVDIPRITGGTKGGGGPGPGVFIGPGGGPVQFQGGPLGGAGG